MQRCSPHPEDSRDSQDQKSMIYAQPTFPAARLHRVKIHWSRSLESGTPGEGVKGGVAGKAGVRGVEDISGPTLCLSTGTLEKLSKAAHIHALRARLCLGCGSTRGRRGRFICTPYEGSVSPCEALWSTREAEPCLHGRRAHKTSQVNVSEAYIAGLRA